jgi:hypothetical protein
MSNNFNYDDYIANNPLLVEDETNTKVDAYLDQIKSLVQKAARDMSDQELEIFSNRLKDWADKGFPASTW